MKNEALVAGGVLVTAVGFASLFVDGSKPPVTRLPGGTEVCTYHVGPKDSEMIAADTASGRAILRGVLALDKKCEFVTLAFPDGTRQKLTLGVAGRKPGEKGPSSTGYTE